MFVLEFIPFCVDRLEKVLLSPDCLSEFQWCCLLLAVHDFVIRVSEGYSTDQIELKSSG